MEWVDSLDTNCLTADSPQRVEVNRLCVTEERCLDEGWSLDGEACGNSNITDSIPDVFLLSVILFLGTFTLAMTFRMFRTSRFFPALVRSSISISSSSSSSSSKML